MTAPKKWVVNASPLILLGKIDQLSLLTYLVDELVIPLGVAAELREGSDTDVARTWIESAGATYVRPVDFVPDIVGGWDLGRGESEVLAWAHAHRDFEAVLDDRAARNCAMSLRVPLLGTLGVILAAKKCGRIALAAPVFNELREAGLRLDDRLMAKALELANES